MRQVFNRLVNHYPKTTLGNFRDPIKEIVYIVLSAKTTDRLYRSSYKRLRSRYASIGELSNATINDIYEYIESGGLGRKRAAQLKEIATKLSDDFSTKATSSMRSLDANEAYTYLTQLPGVGPKSALCVMMYSLDYDVFPVDTNVQRVFCRIGAIRQNAKHYAAQQRLPAFVPDGVAKELHIALVQHGRVTCKSYRPKCDECCIVDLCKTGRRLIKTKQ